MKDHPRVALFADTFYEINGAANVLRKLKAFAEETGRNFLCVCSGSNTRLAKDGPVWTLELKRGRLSVPIDGDLRYDPFLWRYSGLAKRTLDEFQPDIIHVTGANDVSQLGFYFAHFGKINAVASWHTNTHEYCGRRLTDTLSWMPKRIIRPMANAVEKASFRGLISLHFLAQMQLAPNKELVDLLRIKTKRPAALMSRGVDTRLFDPAKRVSDDSAFVLGYVGRLRPEKNVRFLADIDSRLLAAGVKHHRWLIVGDGGESNWLKANLSNAELTGVLRGDELAAAYAGMDLFVFPSKTDAFGNVVLEAAASGVPAIVMSDNGPKFLIKDGVDGFIAEDDEGFVRQVVSVVTNQEADQRMRIAARSSAEARSWTAVFEQLYRDYRTAASFAKGVRAEAVQEPSATPSVEALD